LRRAQQLGRYHLLDRIAFGGMAEIYRAKTFDASGHAHLVAVKRVLAHLAEDDDFIQMLVDEAKIAGLLRHPNIARVYEFARAHGEYFIAMEHVDGKDLRTILERCRAQQKPIPPEHAAWIAAEVAAALHASHTAVDRNGRPLRIVHRDVSPSNVICAYTGEVKLCDFGIAKATLSKVNTRTGVIKGKVKYMSPEQALGRRLDHRSDIFSLGSCLYEMLTRVPPFTATNEMDLLIKVRDARYRPMAEIWPGIPPELEAICDKCLSRSRANRYQTAAEAGLALAGFSRKYMPNYARSYLGRYIRKMFAPEIERELRMLEEFVLGDVVDNDVGENLIADDLADKEYSQFSPRPRDGGGAPAGLVAAAAAARAAASSSAAPPASEQTEPPGAVVFAPPPVIAAAVAPAAILAAPVAVGPPAPTPAAAALLRPPAADDFDVATEGMSNMKTVPLGSADDVRADAGGFDIHAAETLILDRLRDAPDAAASPAPPPAAAEPQPLRDDFDEALHNAPTLILDSPRGRGKRGGGR
jgi:serine/threonine-protein kinase